MSGEVPVSGQQESQSQQQAITISVDSSGDPDLERRIFGQVHSVGRQLRNLAAVVEVLIAAHEADPAFAPGSDARAALEAFKKMQLDIEAAKAPRSPDQLISQLEALRRTDAEAFGRLRDRLVAWLPGK